MRNSQSEATILERFQALEHSPLFVIHSGKAVLAFVQVESRHLADITPADEEEESRIGQECLDFLHYFEMRYRSLPAVQRWLKHCLPDTPLLFRLGETYRQKIAKEDSV